jgi:hypothetical protein
MTKKTVTRTIIPASPGWQLAMFIEGYTDDDGKKIEAELDHAPIIAWEIERVEGEYDSRAKRPRSDTWVHRHVEPVTVNHNGLSNWWMIKRPDGKYERLFDATYDDEASALAEFNRLADEAKRWDAAKAAMKEETHARSD